MKLILLVEDCRLLRAASEHALSKAGYSVIAAGDGEEALRMAHERVPDLILLDILLPKLGGAQVLRQLKSSPDTAQIPVIVLSSLTQKNEEKLKKEGAVAYFEKSRLNLENSSEPLIRIVRQTLLELAEQNCVAGTCKQKECSARFVRGKDRLTGSTFAVS
jgi:CheY-like chemotaxis protein